MSGAPRLRGRSLRPGRLALAGLVAAVVPALFPAQAAAQPCWQTVINDWNDNGTIDGTYPVHCYRDALANLPEDMAAYSSAPADIQRAMREAIRNSSSTGAVETPEQDSVVAGTSGQSTPPTKPQRKPKPKPKPKQTQTQTQTPDAPVVSGTPDEGSSGVFGEALQKIGPRDASSFPLPLLIIAVLAGLLVTAGGVGFAARRLQSRRLAR